ncbi:hypothetical protein PWY87_12030 [Kribbella solani]|uniref:hypothetical protein n=1 Tax=Kribbella solani TaxID=236067 RepID=UPI0029A638C6|nr:hypothetical protein [Kribbella solani]MDX3002404.1 hypothetical protein [Kribbella solani]
MKRFGMITGMAALAGAGALMVGGAVPSQAAVASSNSVSSSSVTYKTRYFNHSSEGYHASAVLPSTWRSVVLGPWQQRFDDTTHNRMIRFNTSYNPNLSTVTALNRKIAALKKGTRGLHIVGTSTVTMKSTTGQGPMRVSTVVYTYRSGKDTRWVATRYVGVAGTTTADTEISTAGSTCDAKLLGTVLNKATVSLALAG